MMLLALSLNLLGMAALSLTLKRHQRPLLGRELGGWRVAGLRWLALLAICAGFVLCLRERGLEQGLLVGACLLMLAGLLQGLLLAFAARQLRLLLPALLLAGLFDALY